MSRYGKNFDGLNRRDRVRRRGSENTHSSPPLFPLNRPPAPARPSREQMRAEAEAAQREWQRRYTPSDRED